MLRKLLIFPLLFVAIYASGEFSILNEHPSIKFQGSDPLESNNINDVLSASKGVWTSQTSNWGGMILKDPFDLPRSVFAINVEGTKTLDLVQAPNHKFEVVGDSTDESFHNLLNDFSTSSSQDVVEADLSRSGENSEALNIIFQDVTVPKITPPASIQEDLHSEDKMFVEQITNMNAIAAKIQQSKKCPGIFYVKVSVAPLSTAHGEKSEAVADAKKLIAASIETLRQTVANVCQDALITVITNKDDAVKRSKRDTTTATKVESNTLNVSEYYSEDYPVIFNIILWFMIAFALSLIAVSYVIGDMDPGRDSIIYRMTSTRMKKDN